MIDLVARHNLSNLKRLDTQTLLSLLEAENADPEFKKLIQYVLDERKVS